MGINLLKIPVDSEQFSDFINKSKIFDQTHELMKGYLASWYNDDATAFVEYMRADLSTVMERYHFYNECVSITKNFNFDPPIDTVSCTIRINDEEDECCSSYCAVFDDQLNAIDDMMKG